MSAAWSICPACGDIVGDAELHTAWHAAIAAPREFFMSVLSATLSISLTFSG